MYILGMGARILRDIWANWTLYTTYEGLAQILIGEHTNFRAVFQKGHLRSFYGVSH